MTCSDDRGVVEGSICKVYAGVGERRKVDHGSRGTEAESAFEQN